MGHLDIWTVFKVSLVFYLLALVVALVAGVILWYLAQAFGILHGIDRAVRSLFALRSFELRPLSVLAWGGAGGALLALCGTLLNVVAALLYNLISDVVGGLQVLVASEEEPRSIDGPGGPQ